ncbi:MAG: DNA adenine methylase [Actinomycetaceae bacterium]|nr:DNA adenine methylase [Actinomycetaceae bacterium]
MNRVEMLSLTAKRRYATYSPLRYPGGKAKLAGLFTDVINHVGDISTYVEPYAGGAGAGLALLIEEQIELLHINDLDPAVYSFWKVLVEEPWTLLEFIRTVDITVGEWHKQKAIYQGTKRPTPELGLAFFFLNRANRSGILNAGVIGGLEQTGQYKINARFNRETLAERVETIQRYGKQIMVTKRDGREIIRQYGVDESALLYIDPPYVKAGARLYLNALDGYDHISLSQTIRSFPEGNWIITYDDHPLIHDLYRDEFNIPLLIRYSASRAVKAEEVMIASPSMAEAIIEIHL